MVRRATLALTGCSLLSVALSMPHFISYFNLPSTILLDRHEMLVDSNLDWGQDLAGLKAYMVEHGIREVKLGYFGMASPRELGLRNQRLPGYAYYAWNEPEWPESARLEPGDVLAVSATSLQGILIPNQEYYRWALTNLRPFDHIGHSILLYRIPPAPAEEGAHGSGAKSP